MSEHETEGRAQELGSVDLPLQRGGSGKVRAWWELSEGRRLIVTTDRLSAFDRILGELPDKGQVLNQLSAFWFAETKDLVDNHLLSVPDPNAAVVLRAEPFAVEVIVRGYITGVTSTALWRRYELGERRIYGYDFPEGLRKNEVLPAPIITPTTKGGPTGHDERLTPAEVVEKGYLDAATWDAVMKAALALFERGSQVARRAGLLLVDTKYEFGRSSDGRILLIDEVHTPDSSRYWRLASYEERLRAGREPESMDKEFIRLAFAERGYRGDGPVPELPRETWEAAARLYRGVYQALTGRAFVAGAQPAGPRLLQNLRTAGILP